MEKKIINQVQEGQRVPYRINPRTNMPRHIPIKLTAAREKQQVTYKGNLIHLTADLSTETLQARREWQDIFTEREKPTAKIAVSSKDLIQN